MLALVTGGGGFLGRAIVERLLARGDRVRSIARGDYPGLRDIGVDVRRGDLSAAFGSDRSDARRGGHEGAGDGPHGAGSAALFDAVQGCDVVFHVAARAGVWGAYDEYHRANVVGTENVLAACRACGIKRLVYTSSPSVVFDGRDMEGVDESVPYPRHYHAPYPATKAIAEQRVLAANGPALATVALRPHLIWGPRDNHLVPRILARADKLRRIGGANKLIDSTYIDNAADAHILAADRLVPGSAVAGRAYFISNGEPRPLWDLVNGILAAGERPPVTRSVPEPLAYVAATMMELTHLMLRLSGEPRLTRFVVRELATAHWFDISAARRDLGYEPRVSIHEGLNRLAAWLANHDPAPRSS